MSRSPEFRTSEALWIVGGRVAYGLGGLVGIRLLTAVMDPALYGRYSLVLGYLGLVTGFLLSPIGHAQNRFLHEAAKRNALRPFLAGILKHTTFLAVLGSLPGLPLALNKLGVSSDTAWVILAGGVVLVVRNFRERQHGAFNTYRWRGRYAVLSGGDAWLCPLLIVGAISLAGASLRSAMLGLAVGATATALAGWPWWRELSRERVSLDQPLATSYDFRPLWRYALPFSGVFALGWVMGVSDRYVIDYFLTEEAVGRYVAGYQVGGAVPMLLIATFFSLVTPIVFQTVARKGGTISLDHYLVAFSALGLLLGGVVTIEPDALGRLVLARAEYLTGDKVIPWVVIGTLLIGTHHVVEHQAYIARRPVGLLGIAGTVALGNVVVNVLAVPRYGIGAAAIATAGSYLLQVALTVAVYRPAITLSTWVRTLGLWVAALVAVLLVRALPLEMDMWIRVVIRAALFSIPFGAVAAALAWPVVRGARGH